MKVASLVVVLLGLASCTDRMEPAPAPAASAGNPQESLVPPEGPADHPTVADSPPEAVVNAEEMLSSPHSNLFALSVEEARWLERHGYPTADELASLAMSDLAGLEETMRNRKDPKAAVLVGHLRERQGDIDGAVSAFAFGANLGSLYARQQLAIAATQEVTGLPASDLAMQADQGNLGVMISQLEVARMLGDHRAQALIDRFAVNFSWDKYGQHVLKQTSIFMDQYGEYARATGSRAVGPDPRPNAGMWAKLQEDRGALVTVYTRQPSYP